MCLAQGKKGVWSGIGELFHCPAAFFDIHSDTSVFQGGSGRLYLEVGRQNAPGNPAMDPPFIAATS